MHALFEAVLVQKNLSKAGDLFSLEDGYIIKDLCAVLPAIREIVSSADFPTNHNDQALVEICITRLTSAIRETRTIERHADALVDLLETCLNYNLRPISGGPDPPHAKIASDVMSCIFLNYSKKNVMRLVLPVSVKFLHKGNKELSRNMSSYLSLAAIENAELLAQHIQPIIDSVISGNYSLSRVLPQIYSVNRDPIKNHVMTLVSILPNCENPEKLALLSLFGLIAKDNPTLLEPSIPQLCEGLTSQATAQSTLQVFYNMAITRPQPLADHTVQFKTTTENFPKTALLSIQLMCSIAKANQDKAQETLDFILAVIGRMEGEKHSMVLKDVVGLINRYPHLLSANVINKLSSLEDGSSSSATRVYIQELRNEFHHRSREKLTTTSGITIVKVGGGGSRGELSQGNYMRRATAAAAAATTTTTTTTTATASTTWTGSRPDISSSSTLRTTTTNAGGQSSGVAARSKADMSSRSTGRLPTHRSMTRLNANLASSQGLDTRLGALHKSMTRLNTSQQNMSRFSSSSQTVGSQPAARSVTCISNHLSTRGQAVAAVSMGGPTSLTSSTAASAAGHGGHHMTSAGGGRVIISTGPGASSPTKSMSSGSMSGVVDQIGREVLTVNVNQINQDLIRQVSSVSESVFNHDMLHGPSGLLQHHYPSSSTTTTTATATTQTPSGGHHHGHAATAPFSLQYTSRRVPPYSSGPLPTPSSSQPPSLILPGLSSSQVAPVIPIIPLTSEPGQPKHFPSSAISHPVSSGDLNRVFRESSSAVMGPIVTQRRAKSQFSNTLPSPRRRQQLKEMLAANEQDGDGENKQHNRMSVFEPYPMRDTVQHFCEKHLNKIKSYMESLMVKLPLPVKCTIEERKGRKHAKLHFACQGRTGEHCLYKSTFYTMKTRNPRTWIHLMFLALQARSSSAISTREGSVSALKNCWEILKCENISFVTLVTGAFPPPKAQDNLMNELRSHRFFDVFEYNGPRQHWGCFLCNHPDRASYFVEEQEPVIEGQLKEKRGGKWKLFKKWKSRYVTLLGDKLTYKDTTQNDQGGTVTQSLDIGSIRSVKVSKEGRRNIPKAFEIFTADKTYILKAKDGSNAQEWVQCLSVAKAHSQAKDTNLKKLAYGGSLGRLNHHGRVPLHHHSLNANIASLRTAV